MQKYICKEGYWFIAIIFIFFLFYWIFYSFSLLLFLLLLISLFIFRISKPISSCNDNKAILSPINGRVSHIENIFDPFLGESVKISIKNAFYHCGSFHAPFRMDISSIVFRHGLFLCSQFKNARLMNEHVCIFASTGKYNVMLKIYAGCLDRSLKLDHFSYKLNPMDKMGFFINGTINIVLPRHVRIYVGIADELKCGSLLGYLD